jgi:hypothetical protein
VSFVDNRAFKRLNVTEGRDYPNRIELAEGSVSFIGNGAFKRSGVAEG